MGYLQCKHRSFDCGLCAKETLKVPAGWQLVPVESTEEMKLAAELSMPRGYVDLYKAMLAAAPKKEG